MRQLTFKHKDGSFSAFGERDDSGNTWSVSETWWHKLKRITLSHCKFTRLCSSSLLCCVWTACSLTCHFSVLFGLIHAWLDGRLEPDNLSHPHTHRQFKLTNEPKEHVFGPCEEPGVPGEHFVLVWILFYFQKPWCSNHLCLNTKNFVRHSKLKGMHQNLICYIFC